MRQGKTIKAAFVYLLLCIYIFGLVKPAMPLAKDFFEHTFFKIEHLATVHLENGKFHVHSELQKEGISQDNTHKNTESTSANEVLANHISNEILDFKVYRSEISKMSHTYIEKPAKVFTEAFIPPPEA